MLVVITTVAVLGLPIPLKFPHIAVRPVPGPRFFMLSTSY